MQHSTLEYESKTPQVRAKNSSSVIYGVAIVALLIGALFGLAYWYSESMRAFN